MGAKDITQEDLLAEVAAFLRELEPHRPDHDWFTVAELYEVAHAEEPELSPDRLRDRLDKGVREHKFEKVTHGRNVSYYRKL